VNRFTTAAVVVTVRAAATVGSWLKVESSEDPVGSRGSTGAALRKAIVVRVVVTGCCTQPSERRTSRLGLARFVFE
jgi:hypothetical protein